MTMQMPDKFIYCGEEVELLSANPKIAFTPLLFGIEASGWTTSNHRGFWCDYSRDTI